MNESTPNPENILHPEWLAEVEYARSILFDGAEEYANERDRFMGALNNFDLFLTDVTGTRSDRIPTEEIRGAGGKTYADLFRDIDLLIDELGLDRSIIDERLTTKPHERMMPEVEYGQYIFPLFEALSLFKGYPPRRLKG